MDAHLLQKGVKREIIVTPFASQLDEIDRALFEHRYRKQNNHHQYNNSNTKYGAHSANRANHHYHQHHQQQQHYQLNNHNNNNQHFYNHSNSAQSGYPAKNHHGGVPFQTRASPSPGVFPQQQAYGHMQQSQTQSQVVMPQQRQLQYQQASYQQVGQAQQYQNHAPQKQQLYGMAAGSVVARSPDSFVEGLGGSIHSTSSNGGGKFDGFSLNLSSSISSGAGSTSSYSSVNEYDLQKKLSAMPTTTTATYDLDQQKINNINGFHNDLDGINGSHGFENANATNSSNRGWLNIWGSDMSVWG